MPMRTMRCPDGDCCEHQENCTPTPVEVELCEGGEGVFPDFETCVSAMIAVVELTFDDDEACDWSQLDGAYVDDGPGSMTRQLALRMAQAGGACDVFGSPLCISPNMSWLVTCSEDGSTLSIGVVASCITSEGSSTLFEAIGDVALPVTITNGYELTLAPQPTLLDLPLLTAKITFYGRPCEESACGSPPSVTFTAQNLFTDAGIDACDPLGGVTADVYTGCTFTVTPVVTPGSCPILKCFWSTGREGCDPGTITINASCGATEDFELTLTAIDERGCIATHTETLNCCNCCEPEGEVTLEFDEYEEEPLLYPAGVGCTGAFGDTDACGIAAHQHCYYRVTFGAGTVTDCGDVRTNQIRYLAEWDGLLDADGVPLADGCYEPGDVVHIRHDAGGAGFNACVKITAFDALGCETEPVYFQFDYAYTESGAAPPCDADPNTCPPVAP